MNRLLSRFKTELWFLQIRLRVFMTYLFDYEEYKRRYANTGSVTYTLSSNNTQKDETE